MIKKNNVILYPTLGSKEILEYFKIIKRSNEYSENYRNIKEKYDSAFWFNSAYQGILKKAKILFPNRKRITFLPITDDSLIHQIIFIKSQDSPKLYKEVVCKTNREVELGLELNLENAKEYGLIINGEGEVSLISSINGEKSNIIDNYSESNSLTIILPLIFYGFLKNPNYIKEKYTLDEIVKKNPANTLSNIYIYVKNHMEEIKKLPEKIEELEKYIKEIYKIERENFPGNNLIINLVGKNFGIVEKRYLPSYFIDNENDILSIKVEYRQENIMMYNYKNYEEYLPSYIQIQGNEYRPYFLQNKFYTDEKLARKMKEKLYSFKNNKGFIGLEEKIEELSSLELEKKRKNKDWPDGGFKEYAHIINSRKNNNEETVLDEESEMKRIRKSMVKLLNENTNFVISALEKHILNTSKEAVFKEQEEYLIKLNDEVSKFLKISSEISAMFGRMYKNEILLKDL